MEARGQYVILKEKFGHLPAGTEGRLIEVGGSYALVAISGTPMEIPLSLLQED